MTQSAYANELAIWDKLQGSNPKGYVLLLRHTLAPGVGDPENFKLNDCSTQRNLSQMGRSQRMLTAQFKWARESLALTSWRRREAQQQPPHRPSTEL